MALTESEITICNQSLDRIAAGQISLAVQTDVKGVACNLHYAKTRDTLLKKFDFSFSTRSVELAKIYTLTLDKSPSPSSWAVGDSIVGIASGATATIVEVTSAIEYSIIYLEGEFEDGETITNATISIVDWEGLPLEWEDETVFLYDETTSDSVVCGSGYPVTAENAPSYRWSHQYYLPADYMLILSIEENDGWDAPENRFQLEGKKILTDYDTMNIRYIRKVTDPAEFDILFEQLLVLALAIKLIPPVCGTDSKLLAEVKQEYVELSKTAKGIDSSEKETSGQSNWNLARFT